MMALLRGLSIVDPVPRQARGKSPVWLAQKAADSALTARVRGLNGKDNGGFPNGKTAILLRGFSPDGTRRPVGETARQEISRRFAARGAQPQGRLPVHGAGDQSVSRLGGLRRRPRPR